EIIQNFAKNDPRIKFIQNSTNRGVCESINSLKDKIQGKYVSFLAADDILDPAYFYEMMSLAKQFPDSGLLLSDTIVINQNNRGSTSYYKNIPTASFAQEIKPHQMIKLKQQGNCFLWGCSCILKTDLFIKYNGYCSSLADLSDWYLNFCIASQHPVAYLPKFLSSYRFSYNTLSANCKRDRKKRKKAFQTFLDLLDQDKRIKHFFIKAVLLQIIVKENPTLLFKRKYFYVFFYTLFFAVKNKSKKILRDFFIHKTHFSTHNSDC
ncbi:MAG: glycosyltransferase, partial [Chlamydiae bacterium]|nr:glycosyltransferase [Chlamydiota bacterium]